jgi:hypothetical protein
LNYYPYGNKTQWESWICGKVDLRKVYKDKRNNGKTEKDYAYSIIEEVGRAMAYLIVHGNTNTFDRQRIEAFALHNLFYVGISGWTKKPLKWLSDKEKEKLYEIHEDKACKLHSNGKYASERDKKYEKQRMKEKTPAQRKEYHRVIENIALHNRAKYGIYFIEHFPLSAFSNSGNPWKCFYTKQELAAIDLMVSCAFENLC